MRFEVKMEQLDPELPVVAGERRSYGAGMRICRLRDESVMVTEASASTRALPHDELLQHRPQDKEQGIEQLYRRIKFDVLFEGEGGFDGKKRCGSSPRANWRRRSAFLSHRAISAFSGNAASDPERVECPIGKTSRPALPSG